MNPVEITFINDRKEFGCLENVTIESFDDRPKSQWEWMIWYKICLAKLSHEIGVYTDIDTPVYGNFHCIIGQSANWLQTRQLSEVERFL